jgi:xylulokinase
VATYVLVVDVGTTNTKGALVSPSGEVVRVASRYAGVRAVDGHLVQDADQVLAATVGVLAECAQAAGPHDVSNIVVGGNQSALVWVDADHIAITPVDSWLDTHYYPHMTRMAAQLRSSGRALDPVESASLDNFVHLAKAHWWLTERPDAVRTAVAWTSPGCYAAGRLAGRRGSEAYIDVTSIAYSGLVDLPSARWLTDLSDEAGVPSSMLPTPLEATETIGALTDEFASLTGLPAGTPLLAGCGDFPAAALGAGADFEHGVLVDIGGTTSLFAAAVPSAHFDSADILRPSPSGRAGEWYLFAHVPGGRAIEWFDGTFGLSRGGMTLESLEDLARAVPIGCEGLVFVPHLSGRMSPPSESMRGAWSGFTWEHNAAHFYRSILEAVGFEYAAYLDRLREVAAEHFAGFSATQIRVVGSAARNLLWNQIKADCMSLPVYTSADVEATARGLAIIGAVGAGIWDGWQEAARRMAASFTCAATPKPDNVARYAQAAERYRRIVDVSDIGLS